MSFRVRLARSRPMRLLRSIALKCWAFSSVYLLVCFLLYWLYGGVLAFLLLCFATTGILYHKEDQLLYHPEQPAHSRVYVPSPSIFNLPHQSMYIKSGDGTMLHMFFISQPEDKMKKVPTILFFHGNAGNMGHRLQNIAGLYHNLQCNILTLEYRGYGLSQGSPSEEGFYMDARAGIDYLFTRTDINTNEIIVFGRSLGGAVAIDLATKEENSRRIWCLILENTFTSIPDMAALFVGSKILQYLPLFIYKNKYLSILKVRSVIVPTLFVSGLADTLVPPRMMEDLYKSCRSSHKRLLPIAGGTHNETWCQPGYYQNICAFLHELRDNPLPRVASSHWHIDDI
ncbi:PREDICTED: alpha/beta hydrolase domain-containing protein 13 [Dinoponera quadriceps]|uniref:Alpha/beta hydrolase domain-containing protein 13 n=1 Tax=Dinoponera quadriceps TaxID=609295 RepID=A0A6P3Y806_DINQU|nr:PREDICTED: alpha/beta hydrolase domain-containing protein 13 [Dinoponera quadriceps]XP_014486503.1 PREDICTED: alpha/beta hydrolase domain-containing protein 13 [Dinoponera quadriceps]XP_014486504.1 PREDICTED: alpha/beta hydrolase domain-containing protein 13 [Dinoponera quadriceps]